MLLPSDYSCDSLLSLSFQLEQNAFHFGHPPLPRLQVVHQTSSFIVIASTVHSVCAQIVVKSTLDSSTTTTTTDTSEPRVLWQQQSEGDDEENEGDLTSLCLTQLSDEKKHLHHLLILLGTSKSRFLVIQLDIGTTGFTTLPLWQPIPGLVRRGSSGIEINSIVETQQRDQQQQPQQQPQQPQQQYTWISYSNGLLVRIPTRALLWDPSPDDVALYEQALKSKLLLPDANTNYVAVPCSNCPSAWRLLDADTAQTFSALVYKKGAPATTGIGDPPTLTVYTAKEVPLHHSNNSKTHGLHSIDHSGADQDNDSDGESELLNVALGATSSLMRGVAGVVQWGFGRSASKLSAITTTTAKKRRKSYKGDDDSDEEKVHQLRFLQLYEQDPLPLTCAYEVHDAPRQISFLSVQKEFAVMSDPLGRVQLMNLEHHFTIIRLWKGVREATCVWTTINDGEDDVLFIHSKQRQSVEAWQLNQNGPRLLMKQTGRDAQLVPIQSQDGTVTACYLLDSGALTKLEVNNQDEEMMSVASQASSATSSKHFPAELPLPVNKRQSSATASSHADAARILQGLQQMLDNPNVTRSQVVKTIHSMQHLPHLCTALDLLAVAPKDSYELHQACIEHCGTVLAKTTGDKSDTSPPVQALERKVAIHTQLMKAFQTLQAFERRRAADHADEDDTRIKPKSAWAVEGMAWLETYEAISKQSLDGGGLSLGSKTNEAMSFASFCSSCDVAGSKTNGNNHNVTLLLSDSSRTRREMLSHIFQPLLEDAFSYTVTAEICDALGFPYEVRQQYLGEWFQTVPAKLAAHKCFLALYAPIIRWIQGLVAQVVDTNIELGEPLPEILLPVLYKFCSDADDLARAFLLASACREGVSLVVKKRESKTYGKVWKVTAVKPWEKLLRKLRICLLLKLRLHGIPLGPFPLTVTNLEDGSIFSLYELLARDELLCSHKHDEIIALEQACLNSGLVFDPSTRVGDDPSRWKTLQQACLANITSEAERIEYLVELDTEVQGALLLYVSHYNKPPLLCAHRALLLAQAWIEEPSRAELLRDCIDALASSMDNMGAQQQSYDAAVRLEIWQTCIRPVFRAFLFGFDHVQEIHEDVYLPLMQNVNWMVLVGKAGLSILSLIERSNKKEIESVEKSEKEESREGWPPLGTDLLLERLVQKSRPVDNNALDVHRVIVSGCMVSNDVAKLSECVDGFYEAFDTMSLLQPTTTPGGDTDKQMEFLEHAILSRAENLDKPILDRFELDEIETLSILWSIDVRDVRTIFLLAMYEFGKDAVVDDLLTRMSAQRAMDLKRFLEDGIGLVCRRLHQVLHVKRNREIRSLLGLLDADTTEWIRNQAEGAVSLLEDDQDDRVILDVSLQSTHFFVLRLMSIAVSNADKETRVKLHSLSILSGTLVKEMERKGPQII